MDQKYRNTAVENLVESLSFEVDAVPQDNVLQYKSTSHITPVNVKVRVRKKDKSGMQKGTICIPKVARTDHYPERIRLASSDQTIMSFNVIMEDPDNRKSKKKNIFGLCLNGTTDDDDDSPYLPIEEASGSKSGHKQKSKTVGNQFAPGDVQRKPKKFFGPCKPGGCLDPPFGEDRYQYLPADTKKPSTDHTIDTKIQESLSVDHTIIEETPKPSSTDEIDTKGPKSPSLDHKIEEKIPKSPSVDSANDNPRKCPKKDNTCPLFDYRVDSATIPFNGLGSAAPDSKEGPDILNENETFIKQHKRKGSNSDSSSTAKISKIITAISSSVQSVSKGEKTEAFLEDKESNSIITYAGDEDDVDKERINKNRKSSVNTNRTSFDLNAPYYLPPKRDSRDKDTNEKTERLRRSFEPLGNAQDENFLDGKNGRQKIMLRNGIELQDEDVLSIRENVQPCGKKNDSLTNTKCVKRTSLQKSQDNGIDKLNASEGYPLDNVGTECQEDADTFLDSQYDYDKTRLKSYDKDQVSTGGTISNKVDEAIEKYKTDDTFTIDNENTKGSEAKLKKYNYSNRSNYYFSDIETGKEDGFKIDPENDILDLQNKERIGVQRNIDIKQTESSKKIINPGLHSEKYEDYLGHDKTDKDDINTLQIPSKDKRKSETDVITASKLLHADKEAPGNSFQELDSKDIVTLKSGAFYKEISDTESDYKVRDSRSSLMNKKYVGNDNTAAVQTATDKDLSSLTKTPITKIDINSEDILHDTDFTALKLQGVVCASHKNSDSDGFELSSLDSRSRDFETRKYESLTKTDKGSDIDIGLQKYDKISAKTGNGSKIDIINRKYDETSTRTGSGSNFNVRTGKYEEISAKTGSSSDMDIRTPKDYEMSAKQGSGTNMDNRTRKYDEVSEKTSSGSNIDNRTRKYDKMSSETGSASNIDIRNRKYDEMSAKIDEHSNKLEKHISLDLAFQNYLDGGVRVLKTLDTPLDSKIQADLNTFVIQKRITHDGEKAHVLIDPDTNMTIQLNRHSVDNNQENDHNIHKGILISDENATHSHHHHQTHSHVTFSSEHLHENLSYLYEKELIPLQNMIKEMKTEIDALARQHKRREKAILKRLRPVGHCSGIIIKK